MQGITDIVLYYFTGTGNALTAARWIRDEAITRGIPSEIRAIDRDYRPDTAALSAHTLVGFLYPTHGFNPAPAMLKFILRFPGVKGVPVFLLNTRAGGKFFKWVAPGLSGMAQLLPMLILAVKGFSLRGGLPLDMPSNWVSLHPACGPRWNMFYRQALRGGNQGVHEGPSRGEQALRQGLRIPPSGSGSLPNRGSLLSRGTVLPGKNLHLFIQLHDVQKMRKELPGSGDNYPQRQALLEIPLRKLHAMHRQLPREGDPGVSFLFAIIVAVAQAPFTMMIADRIPLLGIVNYPLVRTLVNGYITLAVTFVLYAILQRFLRVKPINLLFTYTSLTKFWGNYRAPGITSKDYRVDNLSRNGGAE